MISKIQQYQEKIAIIQSWENHLLFQKQFVELFIKVKDYNEAINMCNELIEILETIIKLKNEINR